MKAYMTLLFFLGSMTSGSCAEAIVGASSFSTSSVAICLKKVKYTASLVISTLAVVVFHFLEGTLIGTSKKNMMVADQSNNCGGVVSEDEDQEIPF